jgi:RHS repeat-associated protein
VDTSAGSDFRHYIFAGVERVAVYSRTTAGINTLRYVLEDHERSPSAIVGSTGTLVVNENFAAYGSRRNPNTWSGSPSAGDLTTIAGITRQGYTGHTMLGNMGLIHMNGRVQDAVTGIFLSADPFIGDAGNTQSYNRYSYVNNNPLSFTDPSGFDPDALEEVVVTARTWSDFAGGGSGAWGGLVLRSPQLQFAMLPIVTVTAQRAPQSTLCTPPALDTAADRAYDSTDPLTHIYTAETSIRGLSPALTQRLADLWRNGPNAAPGIAPNTPDFTPTLLTNLPSTPDTNWIYIRPISGGWVNVTLPGHYFYAGTVTNAVTRANGVTTLLTTGTGNTLRWLQNDTLGATFFKLSQLEAIAALLGAPRVRIGTPGTCN